MCQDCCTDETKGVSGRVLFKWYSSIMARTGILQSDGKREREKETDNKGIHSIVIVQVGLKIRAILNCFCCCSCYLRCNALFSFAFQLRAFLIR